MCENRYPVSAISRLRMGIDGDGIRTLIVFQGCLLRCRYCINPSTWDGSREPKMMTAREIYNSILMDRLYIIATRGGVTFGGGEPLLQSTAIKEFAALNKDQFSIYVETSLNVPWENIEQVVDVVDRFYVDIKTLDEKVYTSYTGGNLENVIKNLTSLLDRVGSDRIVVRIPKIPGFVNKISQIRTKMKLRKIGLRSFDLFKYQIPKAACADNKTRENNYK